MGIDSLLKVLKSISKKKHISDYKNQRVAVDTYCWLHKAIYLCAQELSDGKETNEYINYCLKKVEMMQKHNITVIMVFDGANLPSKQNTEEEREKKRNDNLQKHNEYKLQGEKEKAYQKLVESIDITPLMASKLMDALKARNIECIVAPYEADAQLAYLSITEYVDVIITEDSDLLAYGAKRVLYKLDKFGYGEEIEISGIADCTDYSFQNWNHQKFLSFCILAGCDYLESVSGIGCKKAHQAVAVSQNYRQAIDTLQRKQKISVPPDYVQQFEKAYCTFLFQRVFCPVQRKMVTVNDFDTDLLYPSMKPLLENNLDFLGQNYPDSIAQQIADGKICPQDLKPYSTKTLPSSGQASKDKQLTLFETPIFGKHQNVQVFKFIKKPQSQILNKSTDKITKVNQTQKNQSIQEEQISENNSVDFLQNNTIKENQHLTNNNILANQQKKTQKIVLKNQQKKLDQYFQSQFKPFKTPSSTQNEQNIQIEQKQSRIEEEVSHYDDKIQEEEFVQYSITDEHSRGFQQNFFYTDYGNFLVQELTFAKI